MPVFHICSRHSSARRLFALLLLSYFVAPARLTAEETAAPPAWKTKLDSDKQSWQETVNRLDKAIQSTPDRVELYSRRGDAHFFRGHFKAAVADYDKMIALDPDQSPGHWRRGIALFYAGKYKEAAAQFDKYHSFDDVDRENGIWRYFSHYKAYGKERARKELLKYEKDDREPFPSVYKLFAGETTPAEILKQIEQAEISPAEREKREFYARLYIGLNHTVEGNPQKGQEFLEKMLSNTWGPAASYGPHYMWQVGRLQWELNTSPNKEETDGMGIKSSKSTRE